ncbi:MAG: glycosyltransferase family 2 protein [Calothrix sp. FI2-JRJ7]|jgi:dolichol-phosphate mannosyltransferase|nr:glycosyltransferase family 2 protein [Calothrix sp. FI2-JRJ7]
MSIIEPNPLLSAPSGALRVPKYQSISTGSKDRILFSLIIPTYNERDNITNVIQVLTKLLDSSIYGDYELIVVDDDSPDGTWEVAASLMTSYPQLRVMRRVGERGLSQAVIRGWQVAKGRILGVIDGDLQHPPHVMLQLLRAVEEGADLAVGSRHVDGGGVSSWSVVRRFLSRGAQVLGLIILPGVLGRVSDPMSGYFMVRRDSIAEITLHPVGYKILLEIIGRGDIQEITEVGYVFNERLEGESKVTWKQYIDYLRHLIRLRLTTGHLERMNKRLNFPIGRFLRFGVVGFSGLGVDLTVFYILRQIFELGLTRSTILSAETAIINNFLWNDIWTFRDISSRQTGKGARLKRFLKFNVICLAGVILQALIVNLLYNVVKVNEYLAKLIAIAVVVLWNFWVNLKLSWRVTDVQK